MIYRESERERENGLLGFVQAHPATSPKQVNCELKRE